jgi:hypothetical protein
MIMAKQAGTGRFKPPPSTIKIVSYEPINHNEIRITLEMTVDIHRLAETGGEFLDESFKQLGLKNPPKN